MTEQCTSTAGKDGPHPAPVLTEFGDSQRENPAMNRVQPTSPRAMRDAARRQAEVEELSTRYDPVLPAREPPYVLIQVLVPLRRYSNAKGPEPAARPLPCGFAMPEVGFEPTSPEGPPVLSRRCIPVPSTPADGKR
jgi:hypothetical protein